MTLWTWTPQCWTPFGNLTYSLQMKREQTFTRLQQTTNCCGSSRMEMSSTASGEPFYVFFFGGGLSVNSTSAIKHIPINALMGSSVNINSIGSTVNIQVYGLLHICFTPVQFSCNCTVQHAM